jgi:hypothetical protein
MMDLLPSILHAGSSAHRSLMNVNREACHWNNVIRMVAGNHATPLRTMVMVMVMVKRAQSADTKTGIVLMNGLVIIKTNSPANSKTMMSAGKDGWKRILPVMKAMKYAGDPLLIIMR